MARVAPKAAKSELHLHGVPMANMVTVKKAQPHGFSVVVIYRQAPYAPRRTKKARGMSSMVMRHCTTCRKSMVMRNADTTATKRLRKRRNANA